MKRLSCAVASAAFTIVAGHECARGDEKSAHSSPAQELRVGPTTFGGRSVYTQGHKLWPCTLYSCGRDLRTDTKRNRGGGLVPGRQ